MNNNNTTPPKKDSKSSKNDTALFKIINLIQCFLLSYLLRFLKPLILDESQFIKTTKIKTTSTQKPSLIGQNLEKQITGTMR